MNLKKLVTFKRPFEGVTREDVKARLTTVKAWQLPKQESSVAPPYVWTNADQDPVPDEKRTWGPWTFVGYWMSDLVTVSTWSAASAVIAVGLSTTDAIIIVLLAGICNAIPTVLNGAMGADLRIPFPIAIRSSFGYWFSYFAVISRGILALFWFGVQSVGGGQAMAQVITAIWPSFATLPNQLPKSAGITTSGVVAYLLYHMVQLPFLLIRTEKLQGMFLAKSILVPPMALAMVIYLCVESSRKQTGAVFFVDATVSGTTRAWLWLNALTSITGGYSTLACNIPDFSRFSKTGRSQWWQLPIIPILKLMTSLFGIIAVGAAKNIYGTALWNPITIIPYWTSPAGRLAAFVCAALWVLAQLCCNVSANSISFANDLTTVFPKYINIRRGVIVCAIIGGWAMVPWVILASAQSFLGFMSGYALFLGPFAGMLFCDYWIVKRRRIDVPALYDPAGRYKYTWGINWRAAFIEALIVGPLLPGLARNISPTTITLDSGLYYLYCINWLFGFCTSVFLYWLLNVIFPAPDTYVSKTTYGHAIVSEGIEAEERSENSNSVDEKSAVVKTDAKAEE